MIEYFRNWARSYNAWVTVIDHQGKPNVSGLHDCDPTIIALNRETLETVDRSDYFLYGQFMRFIQRDAVRIATSPGTPASVAFRNPDGTLVLIVSHSGGTAQEVGVTWRGETSTASLGPKSVATFRWKNLRRSALREPGGQWVIR